MKACILKKYGPPLEVVAYEEVEKPIPASDEVLIRVKATAVNDYDWSMSRGRPYAYRVFFGLTKPRTRWSLGMEYSGVVEGVGENVTEFQVGDEVYGDTSDHSFGCFADYVCLNQGALVRKPDFLPFVDAAALPHAGLLAWQGLVVKGELKQGQDVLINGGGGGAGMIALQIAKSYGCRVTGVDTGPKLQTMLDMGYDSVIDFKTTNFTKEGLTYDVVFDCKSDKSPWAYKRALKPEGIFVTVGGKVGTLLRLLFFGKLSTIMSKKQIRILGLKANQGLEKLHELIVSNKVKLVIDGPHHLADAAQQIERFGNGMHTGKIVLTPQSND